MKKPNLKPDLKPNLKPTFFTKPTNLKNYQTQNLKTISAMKKKTVLLIEDDYKLGETIKDILEAGDVFALSIHSDDIDLLDDLSIDPHTIILDFYHRVEVYAELLYLLRRKYSRAKFIVLTGKGYLSDEILREIATELHVSHVIKKPFHPGYLLEKIDHNIHPVFTGR